MACGIASRPHSHMAIPAFHSLLNRPPDLIGCYVGSHSNACAQTSEFNGNRKGTASPESFRFLRVLLISAIPLGCRTFFDLLSRFNIFG